MSHLTLTDEQYRAYVERARQRNEKRLGTAKKRVLDADRSPLAPDSGRKLEGVRKPSKYRSRKTGGYASKKEARHAQALRLRLQAGEIFDLREQVSFELLPAQRDQADGKLIERPVRYVADFVFEDADGALHVQDVKGQKTGAAYALFVVKRKLMLHVHKIRIIEV